MYKTFLRLTHSFIIIIIINLTEREETIKLSRRKVFCQITQHLLENHNMWKRVLASEVQEDQKEDQNCIGGPTDLITAIHEEVEEEQASKEEGSTDGLDEGEMISALEEEEGLSQTDASGENEA